MTRARPVPSRPWAAAWAAAALWLGMPAPAQAQLDFLTNFLMPESQEAEVAQAEHPKILAQFGGEYGDPALVQYLNSIAGFLGRNSDRPDIQYRVTLLNSPIVNAFALPAGYLYLTRGLLALAEDEAELAGVVGHEIGHVTARHTAQRYSRGVLAQGVVGVLGILTRDSALAGLAQLAEPAAMVALQSFSREQEHEADLLGIQSMARAGFDPQAMASFLESLDANTQLEARLAGRPSGEQSRFDLFATHPRTADRVRQTIEAARAVKVARPTVARDTYLRRIDGMLYGDDPAQGIVRGRTFIHPELDIRFEAPPGFQLLNGPNQVVGQSQQGGLLRFDMQQVGAGLSPERYIAEDWAAGRALAGLQSTTINGFPAATASTTLAADGQPPATAWLLALRGGGEAMYRFLFLAPSAAAAQIMPGFHPTMQSFRRTTPEDRALAKPQKLRIVTVRPGDTVERLADRMAFPDSRLERFLTLNSLQAGARLEPNRLVKIVTE